ncbi:MAG: thymidine phosphorylase [Verrucomicrobiales bacterium]
MHVPTLIARKREGGRLEDAEIRAIIRDFTSGSLPDYQMAALAMAIYFRGMDAEETASLVRAMKESGDHFTWPDGHPTVVDKHSTGGIGDKISLVLAPLLACEGLWVPMVSGRGLGITGGTLDKLESIPGFNTRLDMDTARAQIERIGVFMIGQTDRFCPADRKLYSLRDVTATVPSIPLIVASIMSKKLAESPDRLVLDVKYGSGAFMKTEAEARQLADAMVATGEATGTRTVAMLNPMSEPIGHAVGNALEVIESVDCLRGKGPLDLENLTLDLAAGVCDTPRVELAARLRDGSAWEKFRELVAAQGGDVDALEDLARVHTAPVIREIPSLASGKLIAFDAGIIGQTALELGAGRARADDSVDFAVGFDRLAKCGQVLKSGESLGRVHARDEAAAERAIAALHSAARFDP